LHSFSTTSKKEKSFCDFFLTENYFFVINAKLFIIQVRWQVRWKLEDGAVKRWWMALRLVKVKGGLKF